MFAIRRRFGKLLRIAETPGNQVGPLVGADMGHARLAAYYCTRYGATAADTPWPGRPSVNPDLISHAWMAADIGMQIERVSDLQVLSERELGSGIDQNCDEIGQRFTSIYEDRTGRTVTKKPDVAIISATNSDYIAIEVERRRRRPLSTYAEKLAAYRANSRIRAVWYVCATDAIADRVGAAAEQVFGTGSSFPLRIRKAVDLGEFYEMPLLTSDALLKTDMKAMQ